LDFIAYTGAVDNSLSNAFILYTVNTKEYNRPKLTIRHPEHHNSNTVHNLALEHLVLSQFILQSLSHSKSNASPTEISSAPQTKVCTTGAISNTIPTLPNKTLK